MFHYSHKEHSREILFLFKISSLCFWWVVVLLLLVDELMNHIFCSYESYQVHFLVPYMTCSSFIHASEYAFQHTTSHCDSIVYLVEDIFSSGPYIH